MPGDSLNKDTLRRRLKGQREALAVGLRRAHSFSASRRLFAADFRANLPKDAVIAVYSAIQSEADPLAFAKAWLRAGGELAYPRITQAARKLSWHLASPDTLKPGKMGILEPLPSAPKVEPEAIALFVVPGLGFSKEGARLGYGGGYYDDSLKASAGLRVGFAFEPQILPELPMEPWDERLDHVVTEQAIYSRSG